MSAVKTELKFLFYSTVIFSSYYEGKGLQENANGLISSSVQYSKATIYKKQKYFHFSYIYLSLAGNIIVYTPNQGTNRKK